MACNRLKLNEEKTQITWLGTRQQLDKVTVQTLKLPNATVPFSSVVNDLGVVLDSQLTMANHVAALSRSCFFHLRRLRAIKQSLTPHATKTLVRAFVSNRLDNCNSLLVGVSSQLLQRLQVTQNAAARLVTGVRRSEHITPILRDLHWLPVRRRITLSLKGEGKGGGTRASRESGVKFQALISRKWLEITRSLWYSNGKS